MESKGKLFSAIAGIVVGAGVTILGAKALSDRKNQKKVSEMVAKGRDLARKYTADLNKGSEKTQELVDKTVSSGTKKAKKLIKVVKTAEKGVKSI